MEAARERVGWNCDAVCGGWGGDHHAEAEAAWNDAATPQLHDQQSRGARPEAPSAPSAEEGGPRGKKPGSCEVPSRRPTRPSFTTPRLLPKRSSKPRKLTRHLPGPSEQHEPSWGGNRGRAGESWPESRRHPGGGQGAPTQAQGGAARPVGRQPKWQTVHFPGPREEKYQSGRARGRGRAGAYVGAQTARGASERTTNAEVIARGRAKINS